MKSFILVLCFALKALSISAANIKYYIGQNLTFDLSHPAKAPNMSTLSDFALYTIGKNGTKIMDFKNSVAVPNKGSKSVTLQCDFGSLSKGTTLQMLTTAPNTVGVLRAVLNKKENWERKLPFDVMPSVAISSTKNTLISEKNVISLQVTANAPNKVDLTKKNSWIALFVTQTGKMWKAQTQNMTVSNVTKGATANVYTVSVTMVKPVPVSGVFLVVGIKPAKKTPFNYYGVVGGSFDISNMFVVHNKNLKLNVTRKLTEEQFSVLQLNGGGVSDYWWIIAESNTNKKQYALSCTPQKDTDYNYLEWRVNPHEKHGATHLQADTYTLSAYWTNSTKTSLNSLLTKSTQNQKFGSISVGKHVAQLPLDLNATSAGLQDVVSGGTVSINVYSIFKTFKYVWEQKNKTLNNSWQRIGKAKDMNVDSKNLAKYSLMSFTVPGTLINSSANATCRLMVYVLQCDNKTPMFANQVTGLVGKAAPSSSAPKKGLGPGAIVGIVCAAVFVCGLLSWWLCMKNGARGDDRYKQLDGN